MLLTMKSKTDHKLQLVIEGRRIKADKVIDHVMNNQTLRQSRLVGTTELSELAMFDATNRGVSPGRTGAIRENGLIPHRSAHWPLVVMLPAFCPQIAPTGPVLPIVPTHKCFTVYYLRFEILHGMEEVIGSIPIRSTN